MVNLLLCPTLRDQVNKGDRKEMRFRIRETLVDDTYMVVPFVKTES
jgi:hypothetical protein